jgi:hypothetical protein
VGLTPYSHDDSVQTRLLHRDVLWN